jgi:hypothetical protein
VPLIAYEFNIQGIYFKAVAEVEHLDETGVPSSGLPGYVHACKQDRISAVSRGCSCGTVGCWLVEVCKAADQTKLIG